MEDVTLRTDNGHRTSRLTKRFIKNVAVLTIYIHLFQSLLSTLHGMSQGRQSSVWMFKGLGKYRLPCNLGGIRMYKVGATASYHNTVGVRKRLDS